MFAHGEVVTRLRAPLTFDVYSDEPSSSADWSAASSLDILGCGVADGGSLEPLEVGRSSVVSDYDVILPPATDVAATDRLVVRGLTCEVLGRPFDWRSPFTGWTPGIVVKVKVVEG